MDGFRFHVVFCCSENIQLNGFELDMTDFCYPVGKKPMNA